MISWRTQSIYLQLGSPNWVTRIVFLKFSRAHCSCPLCCESFRCSFGCRCRSYSCRHRCGWNCGGGFTCSFFNVQFHRCCPFSIFNSCRSSSCCFPSIHAMIVFSGISDQLTALPECGSPPNRERRGRLHLPAPVVQLGLAGVNLPPQPVRDPGGIHRP